MFFTDALTWMKTKKCEDNNMLCSVEPDNNDVVLARKQNDDVV